MTGSHPPSYENYPPPTADRPIADEPGTGGSSGWTPTPAPSGGSLQPGSGPQSSRRTVLTAAGLVVAGVVAVTIFANNAGEPDEPDPMESSIDDPDDPDEPIYDLDGYQVVADSDWQVRSSTPHRLVLANGPSLVTFLAYQAGQDAAALDEARQQLKRYAAEVRTFKQVSDNSEESDDLETAELIGTGTVDGKPVDVVSSVRIAVSDDYQALAVVSVVLKAMTVAARRAKQMREDFLDQLG